MSAILASLNLPFESQRILIRQIVGQAVAEPFVAEGDCSQERRLQLSLQSFEDQHAVVLEAGFECSRDNADEEAACDGYNVVFECLVCLRRSTPQWSIKKRERRGVPSHSRLSSRSRGGENASPRLPARYFMDHCLADFLEASIDEVFGQCCLIAVAPRARRELGVELVPGTRDRSQQDKPAGELIDTDEALGRGAL